MEYLAHHGIKGQKWGVRRYQNADGTLTDAGKKRNRRKTNRFNTIGGGISGAGIGYYTGFAAAMALESLTPLAALTAAGAVVGAGAAYVASKKDQNAKLNAQFESILPTRKLSNKEKQSLGITDYINKGGVLPKNSNLYRVGTTDSSGKEIFGNRTYFSTNEYDNKKWEAEFVPQYANMRPKSFKYTTTKDLKIAPATALGKEFLKMQKEYSKSPSKSSELNKEIDYVNSMWGFRGEKQKFQGSKKSEAMITASSLVASSRTKSGKELVDRLMKQGYHGVGDINGIDVANDPVIIFDAHKKTNASDSKAFKRSEIKKYSRNAVSRTKDVRGTVSDAKSNRELLAKTLKSAVKNTDLTNKEIAKRFGITESELKSLVYS